MSRKTPTAIYESIIEWLQIRDNFLLINGVSGLNPPIVSGKKLKRKDAHSSLALFVNQKHNTQFTDIVMKRKYDWLMQMYKKAMLASESDSDSGKRMAICPFYKEIEALYREIQNISHSNGVEPLAMSLSRQEDPEEAPSSPLDSDDVSEQIPAPAVSSVPTTVQGASRGAKRKSLAITEETEDSDSQARRKPASSRAEGKSAVHFPGAYPSGRQGKLDLNKSYLENQKERWILEKKRLLREEAFREEELNIKRENLNKVESELQLQKDRMERDIELRQDELRLQQSKFDKEIELRQEDLLLQKTKFDKEVELKQMELEANLNLRREEMALQKDLKSEEVKRTQMLLAKDMLAAGKTTEEIKEFFQLFN
ncbi:hypothetical protein HDU91_005025 [Kappamyces sp. JEL0680]|nr:hypothetical protein HDU91_005025 [Kappamyces sp. JEL0680]